MSVRIAIAWVAVWVLAMILAFSLLPGRQSWPVEFGTIVGVGVASYVALRLVAPRL